MQQQIFGDGDDQNYEIFIESTSQIKIDYSTAPDDIYFEEVVAALQDIIMEEQFEQMQTTFMKTYCQYFEEKEENKMEYMEIFQQYHNSIEKYIQNALIQRVTGFQMADFLKLLANRTHMIDEQILDMLQSFSDFETFKRLILDYKAYYEEQEQLQLLTIKSNKIPQNKKVKSNTDNIFGGTTNTLNLGVKPLAQKKDNKIIKKQKTQEQLLIPELVLTVRPLRKMVTQ